MDYDKTIRELESLLCETTKIKLYSLIIFIIILSTFSGCVGKEENERIEDILLVGEEYQIYKVWRGYAYGFFYLVDYVDGNEIKSIRLPSISDFGEDRLTVILSNRTRLVKDFVGYKPSSVPISHWTLYLNSSQEINGLSSEYSSGKSTTQSDIEEVR